MVLAAAPSAANAPRAITTSPLRPRAVAAHTVARGFTLTHLAARTRRSTNGCVSGGAATAAAATAAAVASGSGSGKDSGSAAMTATKLGRWRPQPAAGRHHPYACVVVVVSFAAHHHLGGAHSWVEGQTSGWPRAHSVGSGGWCVIATRTQRSLAAHLASQALQILKLHGTTEGASLVFTNTPVRLPYVAGKTLKRPGLGGLLLFAF